MKINQVHFDCSSIPHTLLLYYSPPWFVSYYGYIYMYEDAHANCNQRNHQHITTTIHPIVLYYILDDREQCPQASLFATHPILYFTWPYVLATPIQKHSSTIKFIRLLNCDFMNLALSMTTTTCVIGLDVKCD